MKIEPISTESEIDTLKVVGKIDLDALNKKPAKKTIKKKEEVATETTTKTKVELESKKDEIQPEAPKEKAEVVEKVVAIEPEPEKEVELIRAEAEKLAGPKILGKIELKQEKRPEQIYRQEEKQRKEKEEEKKKEEAREQEKKKRARIHANKVDVKVFEKSNPGKTSEKVEVVEKVVTKEPELS